MAISKKTPDNKVTKYTTNYSLDVGDRKDILLTINHTSKVIDISPIPFNEDADYKGFTLDYLKEMRDVLNACIDVSEKEFSKK